MTKIVKYMPWDDMSDGVVIRHIQEYPSNLKLAFVQAAIELGRSESSVSQRYYSSIRKNHPVLVIGSEKGMVANTKIVQFKGDQDSDTRKAMLVAMFGSLNPEEVIGAFLDMLTLEEQKSLFKRSIAKLT